MKKSVIALALLSVLGSGSAMASSADIDRRDSVFSEIETLVQTGKEVKIGGYAVNRDNIGEWKDIAKVAGDQNTRNAADMINEAATRGDVNVSDYTPDFSNSGNSVMENTTKADHEREANRKATEDNRSRINENKSRTDANENRSKNNETKIDKNSDKIANNDRNIVHNGSRIDNIYKEADKVAKDLEKEYNVTAKAVEAEYARTTAKIEGNTKAIGELRNDFSKMAQRQDQLEKRTDQLEGKLSNGIAAVGALAAMPAIAGEAMHVGAGVSNYNGSTAIAVGLTKAWENGVAVKAGLAYAQGKFSQKDTMVNAGVSYAL
ncbi:YadA-like family protein [Photobacterium kagoshimensis]|uniref:YadA C-terminal domain-containing protein n=1 Tax=Photobacterium kagoshimensis TaxID=2910242 RepID=UPI003D0C43A0